MTFVALLIPDWPTGAAANDLLAQLLSVAPRAAITPDKGLAWLDARGLDPGALVERVCEALGELGMRGIRAGAAAVPSVAIVAAERSWVVSHDFSHVVPGTERTYLAPLPLDVLKPIPKLMAMFASVGLVRCGDLARLTRESVEVRFGRDGLALWKLARADDPRLIFSARPRELPTASLDWTEFSTSDLEQLVFVLHSLLKTVCDAIAVDGVGARSLTLTLSLENRTTIVQSVGAARSTAQRTTWLRLMRRTLERITLPDRVTGIAIQVDAVGAPAVRQGDLFDLGFASAHGAESAVAHVLDLQGDAVVTIARAEHSLFERRVKWVAHGPEAWGLGPEQISSDLRSQASGLNLQLLPAPREVIVLTQSRRGFATPVRYTDNGVPNPLKESLGPHCISGDRWTERVAREYHQGVRADGVVVLLYRDVLSEQWYLAGWWD